MNQQQLILFDYNSLDTDTRVFVQEKAQSIHARLKRTAEDIIAIGQDLIEVKDCLSHGQFIPWLQSEFGMSRWTAQDFMRVAEKFRDKWGNFPHLSVSVLYELATPSMPETVVEMVESGEIPATLPAIREAKQEIASYQPTQQPMPPAMPVAPPPVYHSPIPYTLPVEPVSSAQPEYRPYVPPEVIPAMSRGVPAALLSSESNKWYTPGSYIHAIMELMGGIDLDPASCEEANRTVQATRYYNEDDDGLAYDWWADKDETIPARVFLNPPYGLGEEGKSNQEIWSHRLMGQHEMGFVKEAVLLVNANTEAKWFQPLYKYLICLTNHRIRFYNTSGESSQPTQGNALVYFGANKRGFIEMCNRYSFGTVIREAQAHEY